MYDCGFCIFHGTICPKMLKCHYGTSFQSIVTAATGGELLLLRKSILAYDFPACRCLADPLLKQRHRSNQKSVIARNVSWCISGPQKKIRFLWNLGATCHIYNYLWGFKAFSSFLPFPKMLLGVNEFLFHVCAPYNPLPWRTCLLLHSEKISQALTVNWGSLSKRRNNAVWRWRFFFGSWSWHSFSCLC